MATAQEPQASDPVERTVTLSDSYTPKQEAIVSLPSIASLPAVTLSFSGHGGTTRIEFGVCGFSNSTWYGPTFNADGKITGTGELPRFDSDGTANPSGSYWRLVAGGAHGTNTAVLILEGTRTITTHLAEARTELNPDTGEFETVTQRTFTGTACYARVNVNYQTNNPPPTFPRLTSVPETRPGATAGTSCYVVETQHTHGSGGTATTSRATSACMTAAEFQSYRGIDVLDLPTCGASVTGACRQ